MSIRTFSTWKRSHKLAVALILILVAVSLVVTQFLGSGGSLADRVELYQNEDVVRFLGKRQIHISYYFNLRRNAEGTKLYISPYASKPHQRQLIIISKDGAECRSAPGKTAYLNSAEEFVAWTDDFTQGVEFKGGYKLDLPQFALFDVNPTGEFFVIGEKPHTAWLGRVDSPQDRILLSKEFLADNVFIQNGKIRISGFAFEGGEQIASCLCLTTTTTGYEIEKRVNLPWAGGVVDADPYSGRLLLQGRSDYFTREHVFDIDTGTRLSIGWAKNWGFFLTTNLLDENLDSIRNAGQTH